MLINTTGISASSNMRQDVPHAVPGVATVHGGAESDIYKAFFPLPSTCIRDLCNNPKQTHCKTHKPRGSYRK